jgi:hypothetical protein
MVVRHSMAGLLSAAAGIVVLFAVSVPLFTAPASAQVYYSIYGGYRKSPPAPYRDERPRDRGGFFSDFFGSLFGRHEEEEKKPDAFAHHCVRTCDGKFFPFSRGERKEISLDKVCSAMCPAAQTKVFSGRGIDYSSAADGQRYTALPNAFAYRTKVVENCTCNGRDPYGVVNVAPEEDLTLEGGDLVVRETGFTIYRGAKTFTPIEKAGMGQAFVKQLQAIKILPDNPHATFAKTQPVMQAAPSATTQLPTNTPAIVQEPDTNTPAANQPPARTN